MKKPKIVLETLELSKKELQSLQNGLSFASWQFIEGGDCASDAKVLIKIHNKIEKQTGLKGEY